MVVILILVLAIIGGCAQEQTSDMSTYIDVTPAEAKQLIDENLDLVIIDVSPNYAQGHLPGAVNYYLGDGSLDRAIPNLDMTKKYYHPSTIRYFNKKGVKIKTEHRSAFACIGKVCNAGVMKMVDHVRNGA